MEMPGKKTKFQIPLTITIQGVIFERTYFRNQLNSRTYLIRTNFRADKFSRIFAQNLDLREIARKLVLNFEFL